MSLGTPLGGSYGFLSQRDVKSQELKVNPETGHNHSECPCCRFTDWENRNRYQSQLRINSLTSLICRLHSSSRFLSAALHHANAAKTFMVPPAVLHFKLQTH